jgi:hypothetical protein
MVLATFSFPVFADTCPKNDPIRREIQTYFLTQEFQTQLSSIIEIQTGHSVNKLILKKSIFPGEAHAGLAPMFIPSGLTALEDSKRDLDLEFVTGDIHDSLEFEFKNVPNSGAYLRFDNWVLCKDNQVIQPFVKVNGVVSAESKKFTINMVWDVNKRQIDNAPSSPAPPLMACLLESVQQEEQQGPEMWGYMTVHPAKSKGEYVTEFIEEYGFFTLAKCTSETANLMNCNGPGIYRAQISWVGFIREKPDFVEIEINAMDANNKVNVISRKKYNCM